MTAIAGTVQTAEAAPGEGVTETPAPAYLAVLDPQLDRAPTTVTVIMANLDPLVTVTFSIDGVVVDTAVTDADGEIGATSIEVDRDYLLGPHTITGTTTTQSGSAVFTLARNPSNFPVHQTQDADPVFINGALENGLYAWVFQDLMPSGLGSWIMPINPTSMTNPHVRKTVGAQSTTAVAGTPHVYQGATPLEWEISGFMPNYEFYLELTAYAQLPRRFYLIDHRNRAWIVAVAALDVKPRKRTRHDDGQFTDWMGEYTMSLALYSQTPKVPVGT